METFNQYYLEIHKQQEDLQKRNQQKNEVQIIILLEQHNTVETCNEENPVYDGVPQLTDDQNDKVDIEESNCLVESAQTEVPFNPTVPSTVPNLEDFPQQIIRNGKLIVQGKELTKMISKFYKLECDLCPSKRFRKFSALVTHFRNQHSSRPYVHCCDMKITRLRRIAMHMARHIQPSAFKCNMCNKFLTSPKILLLHLQNHLPEEKRRYACPEAICNRRFSYQSALVNHSLSHLSEEDRSVFGCCDKKFANSARLKSHIAAVHSTVQMKKFTCDICSRVFTTRSNLIYHVTTHQIGHQVQCKLCLKWLKNKICLKKHMTTHSETKFACEICDYSSANKQCLVNHQKVHHSEVKPFNCEVCGNSFKLKNTLVNHINAMHKGLRKYKCEFCAKTFVSSGNCEFLVSNFDRWCNLRFIFHLIKCLFSTSYRLRTS